ncbi:Hypothetical predicted protein [Cloeon dipterum]|uniref:CTCHY-type domain-containing protein n=1 Tax=Cloeon dipterum TaxID=197152 RepID=A0A8S1DG59_9INSE|nr:Hypothetical predicted protein [Cloeon dipterum]
MKSAESHKVLSSDHLDNCPRCPHGPMLLFEKTAGCKTSRFFACAAFRSRKECQFFVSVTTDQVVETGKIEKLADRCKSLVTVSFWEKYQKTIMLKERKENVFCHSCTSFICDKSEINCEHKGHKIETQVKTENMRRPTKLLKSMKETTKEAQFFFSEQTSNFITSTLDRLGVKSVISIGTPSLIERLKINYYLLDFDWRYGVFYGDNFSWYNMFNHHFMETMDDPDGSRSKTRFKNFINSLPTEETVAILLDPPFGGRVEPIASTLKKLVTEIRETGCLGDVLFFWVFPYFMEAYISNALPGTAMLDYRIDYSDHKMFNSDSRRGRKTGSPVRIFTNAPLNLIVHPEDEGYNFCSKCSRFVHKDNVHCNLCGICPSKAGGTYKHCSTCQRCVKPRWIHCGSCSKCVAQPHECNNKKRKLLHTPNCPRKLKKGQD